MVNQAIPKNHDIWLNKLRWKTAYKELDSMNELILDCSRFIFIDGIKDFDKQQSLIDFMGDSEHLNSLNVTDFCKFFLKNDIKFKLRFKYIKKRNLAHNIYWFFIIKELNKRLKELLNSR